jgi:CRISPR system Cascade subunit CasE
MENENYFLYRISPKQDLPLKQVMAIGNLDPYGQHQAIWKLFDLPRQEKKEIIEFLFRFEIDKRSRLPVFYVLSCKQTPLDREGLWEIAPKEYKPDICEGDWFDFKLRVNPTQHDKKERTEAEIEKWNANRKERGFKEKTATKKRIRHDVVMQAKTQLKKDGVPREKWPHINDIIHKAGINWLRKRGPEGGFAFKDEDNEEEFEYKQKEVRAEGYQTHQFYKKGTRVQFSSLDFTGRLTVTDPEQFKKILFNGLGPAKGFGCGLMLVRRV